MSLALSAVSNRMTDAGGNIVTHLVQVFGRGALASCIENSPTPTSNLNQGLNPRLADDVVPQHA